MSEAGGRADDPARDDVLVEAFVHRHYAWRGAFRTHRAALGFDLLRAPLNVALAPVFVVVRLASVLLTRLRLRRAGRWLGARRILLRPQASRAIERALIDEVLRPRMPEGGPPSAAATRMVEEYVGIRSAVSEIVTTLVVFCVGLSVFRAATPGVLTLAPVVSERAVFANAIADFPLGSGLGRAWYAVFPVEVPGWYVAAVAVALVCTASVVTTFAGLIADPLQAYLGIHRRRLMRLLTRIDRAEEEGAEIAPEHVLARFADITDAATALLRMMRP
jgi:hypothetical protein